MQASIHPSAIVDPKSEIGAQVTIGPFCIVKEGVRIKKGTTLLSHVVVEGSTEIGENCTIHPFASIGMAPQDLKYKGENTRLVIGDNNIVREYASIHRASVGGDGSTVIGNDNFLMGYVHIAHDCKVGNSVIMANGVNLSGHVTVENHVVIGGLSGLHQYTRVGEYAMVGGASKIVQDAPPYMIVAGHEAKLFGLNTIGLKRHGFDDSEVNDLKKAYKILFREKRTLSDAIMKINAEIPVTDHIRHLITFIEENKRGICR
ncbi:MAG: acyl-ACP--UDP-N-acetylglucosamine O-acyltransferase [Nitrospirae bacterium]|nr:MAG: acyl-ACP--UDP-N-acetylglucosamine O-acyltransferase [Nitrospirota bacterium]